MAKRHVVQYFLEVEKQYLDMIDLLPEFNELLTENKISQEEYNQASQEMEKLKSNYERISYIMFLLNRPNKKSKSEDAINKAWYKELATSSKEAIIDENRDVLSTLKHLLKDKGDMR